MHQRELGKCRRRAAWSPESCSADGSWGPYTWITSISRDNSTWLHRSLLDHLVGAQQCRGRHVEAECLGGLKIEHELEFRCPFDRNIGGIGALENLVHEESRVAIGCNKIYSVAHHTARPCDIFRPNREKPPSCRQRRNCSGVEGRQGVVAGLDRLHIGLFNPLEDARQLARLPPTEWVQFYIEQLRRRLHCLKFRLGSGIIRVQDDGHLGNGMTSTSSRVFSTSNPP